MSECVFVCLLSRHGARRVSAEQLIFNERGMRGIPPTLCSTVSCTLSWRPPFSCFHVCLFIMAWATAPQTDGVFEDQWLMLFQGGDGGGEGCVTSASLHTKQRMLPFPYNRCHWESVGKRNLTTGSYYFSLEKKILKNASKHPPFSSRSPDPQISQSTPANFTPSQPRISPLQRATLAKDADLIVFEFFAANVPNPGWQRSTCLHAVSPLKSGYPVKSGYYFKSIKRTSDSKHHFICTRLVGTPESELSVPLHWSTSTEVRQIRIWRWIDREREGRR